MYNCPTEIWVQIFEAACTDDGSTGRSISLVSRFFYEVSSEVKLQSLSVVGVRQILECAKMLGDLPPRLRRVRHLFVSNCLEIPFQKTRLIPGRHLGFWEHDTGACAAFVQILQHVAPTLQTLYLVSNIPRTCVLVPVSLPNLTQMTLQGPIPPSNYPNNKICTFQSLRYLRFLSFTDYPVDMFQHITQQAPFLSHLYLSPTHASRHLHGDLTQALSKPHPHVHGDLPLGIFPAALKRIYIQPGPPPAVAQGVWINALHQYMLRNLANVAQFDKRVVIVEATPACKHNEAIDKWLQGDSELFLLL